MDGLNPQIFTIQLPPRLLAQPQQTTPFLPEDIHICGNCKQSFTDIRVFLQHKNDCNAFVSSATAALLGTTPRVNLQMLSQEPLLQVMVNGERDHQQDDSNCSESDLGTISSNNVASAATVLDNNTSLLHCDTIQITENDSRRDIHIDEEDVASLLASQFAKQPVYSLNNISAGDICMENKDATVDVVNVDVNNDTDSSLYFQETIGCSLTVSDRVDDNTVNGSSDYVKIAVIPNNVDSGENVMKAKNRVKAKKKRPAVKEDPAVKVAKVCDKCDFVTVYASDLTRHKRIHTGEKPFGCGTCGQRFSRSDKLQTHQRIHTGDRPYKCQFCSYAAIEVGSLRKHVRIHTDERPFKCQFCPYSAKDTSQLTVHLRRHTGDTPFVCQVCLRAFRTRNVLNRHNKVHKKSNLFPCKECTFKAPNKFNLKTHYEESHRKDNSLLCDMCGNFKAQHREELYEHQQRMHTDDNVNANVTVDIVSADKKSESARRSSRKVRSCKTHTKAVRSNSATAASHACSFCVYQSRTQNGLKQHMCKQHPGAASGGSNKKPRTRPFCQKLHHCLHCTLSFVREDSLRCHLKQHQSNTTVPFASNPDGTSNSQRQQEHVDGDNDQTQVEAPSTILPESEVFTFDNIIEYEYDIIC